MTKMKRITAAILCAILCTLSICVVMISAETDPISKFSEKLKEAYASGEETVRVYIYYEDNIDFDAIEAKAVAYATEQTTLLRMEGDYTEDELQIHYNYFYNYKYDNLEFDAYVEMSNQMIDAIGLYGSASGCSYSPYIHGRYSYEEALVIAENELVVSMELHPDIEAGVTETREPTEDWTADSTTEESNYDEPTSEPSTDPTEPPTDAPDLLVGDVDEDGMITATDASNILILAAEMGLGYEPTFEELYAADYNADGNADATDASLILIYAAEEGVK